MEIHWRKEKKNEIVAELVIYIFGEKLQLSYKFHPLDRISNELTDVHGV